jgi:hypothetical protein
MTTGKDARMRMWRCGEVALVGSLEGGTPGEAKGRGEEEGT